MPLDTSTYSLALLRLDGRRWNEIRRTHAQISTQAAADGSSYLEMGNTKILVSVTGPAEGKQSGQRGGSATQADKVAKMRERLARLATEGLGTSSEGGILDPA